MFLLNSRLRLFTAATSSSRRASFTLMWHPFSLSYGARLPSSLTRVLSNALGFSPHPPVSVYGTVAIALARGFSWQCGINQFRTMSTCSLLRVKTSRICLRDPPTSLNLHTNSRLVYPPASPHRSNALWRYRNFNLFPIAYAFRPRLRGRLTLGRLALPRNP